MNDRLCLTLQTDNTESTILGRSIGVRTIHKPTDSAYYGFVSPIITTLISSGFANIKPTPGPARLSSRKTPHSTAPHLTKEMNDTPTQLAHSKAYL